MEKKILILNKKQIEQKINRIAYQILEDTLDEKEIVIAGIAAHGYTIAKRLKSIIERISQTKALLINISMNKVSTHLDASLDVEVANCTGKTIILVDDVLNSGRTLAYGLGVFLNIPLKKIRTVVLVDRSHRIFPVSPDYTGLELATVLKEHVEVVLDEANNEDAVYLS
ncbi:phosphoribosyltransferase family protein [Rubrolithibacter danxiaensis]|uniref:phosphoribosyltransferase family protein n=1 Tax=Rubrolithibacter danxiaensis TaxID=3390805 RepID=UPI003BF7D476